MIRRVTRKRVTFGPLGVLDEDAEGPKETQRSQRG